MNKIILLLTFFLLQGLASSAQQNGMEEFMYSSGKIYTFLAVALVILVGMFLYIIRIDKKVGKLEKSLKSKEVSK